MLFGKKTSSVRHSRQRAVGPSPQVLARAAAVSVAVGLVASPGTSAADQLRDEIEQLRITLRNEIATLRQREQQLNLEVLRLDQKSQLLDRQLRALRAAGVGRPAAAASASTEGEPPSSPAPPVRNRAASSPARTGPQAPIVVAQQQPDPAAAAHQDSSGGSTGSGAATVAAPTRQGEGQTAPITGPRREEEQARRTLETSAALSTTGGVLTPKGQVQISPTFGYDYTSQNQLGVNGFQIIPGITFGNVFVNRVEQNVGTFGATVRVGITDRLELNVRVPYVLNETNTTSLIPIGANAQQLSTTAFNYNIGDIQFGASYQINAGLDGWPIFIANAAFKTVTGTSPYEVPIYTVNDTNGQFLRGIARKSPTGTGFYSITPSLTVIYPTAPGTLFANLLYTNNLGRRVSVRSTDGGPPTAIDLTPGEAVGLTVGIGFALNDRASLTLSYQQQHVFSSLQNGQTIRGSSYSFGSFNFGIGYELSERLRVNANVGIGVGPNTPAARLLIEFPYRFSL